MSIIDPSSEAGQRLIRNSAFEQPLTQGDPPEAPSTVPVADMHYRIPHTFRAACGAPSAWGIHWTQHVDRVTCSLCVSSLSALAAADARKDP